MRTEIRVKMSDGSFEIFEDVRSFVRHTNGTLLIRVPGCQRGIKSSEYNGYEIIEHDEESDNG